jgi:hypothetical protein
VPLAAAVTDSIADIDLLAPTVGDCDQAGEARLEGLNVELGNAVDELAASSPRTDKAWHARVVAIRDF